MEEKKTKKLNSKAVVGIVAALVLILVLVIVLVFSKDDKKKEENSTTTRATVKIDANGQEADIVCQKLMNDDPIIKSYLVYKLNTKDGRVLSMQSISKNVYGSKEDFENFKESFKDKKNMTFDEASLSSTEIVDSAFDLTKDPDGNEMILPLEDYVASLTEQQFECK